MGFLFIIEIAFTIWMAIDAGRRGSIWPWMWIILLFQPLGPFIYFFVVYYPSIPERKKVKSNRRSSAKDERLAESDTRRLDNADAWIRYASILRERKKYREAVEAANRAIAKNKRSGRAQMEYGQALLASGRAQEAIEPLKKAVKKEETFEMGEAHYALAKAYHETGDLSSAQRVLVDLSTRSSRPQYLYALAGIQMELGEREAAQATCQRIIDEAEYVPKYLRKEVTPWVRKAKKALRTLGS